MTSIAAKTWVLGDALTDVFDATLVAKGEEDLVGRGREVKGGAGDAVYKLGKLIKRPFAKLSPSAIIRYLMLLPLNLIPVVGTVVWVILRGKGEGPAQLARYHQLKGYSAKEKEEHVKEIRGAYTR